MSWNTLKRGENSKNIDGLKTLVTHLFFNILMEFGVCLDVNVLWYCMVWYGLLRSVFNKTKENMTSTKYSNQSAKAEKFFFYSYSYIKNTISRQIYQINIILMAILDFEPKYLPNLPTFFWLTLNLDSPHIEVEKSRS